MKNVAKSLKTTLASVVLLGAGLGSTGPAAAAQAAEIFQVDPVHSAVEFKVRHLLSKAGGNFDEFSGTLRYDAQNPAKSRFEFTIQVASIDTDNEKRDQHLRSADFFDVETYPAIGFKSTRIEPAGQKGHYKVTGDFTMHGVTKSIVVDAEVLGFAETGMGMRGGVDVETTIDRKAFGIVWNQTMDKGGVVLGDDVDIDISLAFYQP